MNTGQSPAFEAGRDTSESVAQVTSDRISRVIFDYAAKIAGAQSIDALLRLNADMARDLVGAERCSIWLIDAKAKQLWTKVAHGVSQIRIPLGQGLVGACVDRNESILVNDTSRDERFLARVDHESGYVTKSVAALPMRGLDGNIIGALEVLNKSGFTPEDIELLGLASVYSGEAIETQRLRQEAEVARLIMRELEIARAVQQHLFPQELPAVAGLDYAGYCRPAKMVGGDYYDFLPMADGGFLFTLGDVAGKGIAAAVLMAGIQGSLRSRVIRPPESMSALMGDLNKTVYTLSTADKYSTLFAGLFDAEMRKLTYVNAGQVRPMLVCARDGRVERLDSDGFPVGLLPVAEYSQGELMLEPDDAIVCFSDGLSEATNAREEMWEESEIEKVLQTVRGLPAREMIARLVASADQFAGDAEQADDMTVVVMRVV